MKLLDIAETAEQAQVKPSALRYYEEIGLISPVVRHGLRRQYDTQTLLQLALIKMGSPTCRGRPCTNRQMNLTAKYGGSVSYAICCATWPIARPLSILNATRFRGCCVPHSGRKRRLRAPQNTRRDEKLASYPNFRLMPESGLCSLITRELFCLMGHCGSINPFRRSRSTSWPRRATISRRIASSSIFQRS